MSLVLHLILLVILSSGSPIVSAGYGFSIREATIRDLQLAFKQNQLTSRRLVEFYLGEIQRLNPVLKGVIEVNPDAVYQADKADRERKAKAPCSLSELHGIPVLLKDNIGTKDKLNTTAGLLALLGSVLPRDAGVVAKLRKAGAVVLGKASLSEWANFRSLNAPNGWSARGDRGKNPYVLSTDPCGSSSGSAISMAANLVAVALGTETDGSILCPFSFNSVVGIKPTVGLTSRAGVIPISPGQDTIGPIGRTVLDAVYVLDAVAGGYNQFLKACGLKGKRLGIVRNPFFISSSGSGQVKAFENHFQTLKEMIKEFGQDIFLAAQITNGIGNKEKEVLLNMAKLSRDVFEKVMRDNRLDALVTPSADAAPILAIGGFPAINVLAGYDSEGVPFGISFGGLRALAMA
ncbi:hypothetical protein I3760_05G079400 [Carya illinoinensis]|nr:hypothetical protein I3760_05G079400 [Carya illinoinensis]